MFCCYQNVGHTGLLARDIHFYYKNAVLIRALPTLLLEAQPYKRAWQPKPNSVPAAHPQKATLRTTTLLFVSKNSASAISAIGFFYNTFALKLTIL